MELTTLYLENKGFEWSEGRKDYCLYKKDSFYLTYEWFSGKWNICFTYSTPGMDRNEDTRIILETVEDLENLVKGLKLQWIYNL